jgi:hypothetical protein
MKKKLKNTSLFETRRLNVLAGLTEAYGHEEILDPALQSPPEETFDDEVEWDGYDDVEGDDLSPDNGFEDSMDVDMSLVDDGTVDGGLEGLSDFSSDPDLDGYDGDDFSEDPVDSVEEPDSMGDTEEWLRNQQNKFKMESKKRKIKSVKLTESQFKRLLKMR